MNYILPNDLMSKNTATQQMILLPHRVKPYPFKGLNDDQQVAILHERVQQVVVQALLKMHREEEERMWALQLEHNRRLEVINDQNQKRQQRAMAEPIKETLAHIREEHR